jgi:hypothetical protein
MHPVPHLPGVHHHAAVALLKASFSLFQLLNVVLLLADQLVNVLLHGFLVFDYRAILG